MPKLRNRLNWLEERAPAVPDAQAWVASIAPLLSRLKQFHHRPEYHTLRAVAARAVEEGFRAPPDFPGEDPIRSIVYAVFSNDIGKAPTGLHPRESQLAAFHSILLFNSDEPAPEWPAEVVAAFVRNPAALPTSQCGNCGLRLPFVIGEIRHDFKACPLCGCERVFFNAWYYIQSARAAREAIGARATDSVSAANRGKAAVV